MVERTFAVPLAKLREAGLRPTSQRLALAKLLWHDHDRHVTAEELFAEACQAGVKISLATVYNTLHQFTRAGLLRELTIEQGSCYFDTNVTDHHHFYDTTDRRLIDIQGSGPSVVAMPQTPEGMEIARVDIIVHLQKK